MTTKDTGGSAMDADEIGRFRQAVADLVEGIDTDAASESELLRWARLGLLECIRFWPTEKGLTLLAARKEES